MFEGYPKPGRSPNDECALLKSRKGFVRLALKNNIPLIPVYCFGGNKMFRRLQLPKVVERVSNILRISIVIVFGKYGMYTCDCDKNEAYAIFRINKVSIFVTFSNW